MTTTEPDMTFVPLNTLEVKMLDAIRDYAQARKAAAVAHELLDAAKAAYEEASGEAYACRYMMVEATRAFLGDEAAHAMDDPEANPHP